MENINIKLNLHGIGRLVAGHPWIRRKDLNHHKNPPEPGTLVRFQDVAGNFIGHGYSEGTRSDPAYRLLSRERHPEFNARFFGERVERAVGLRRKRLADCPQGATRLINGENDGLPGLFCDSFGGWAVMDVLSPGIFRWLELIERALLESVQLKGLVRKVRFVGDGSKLDDSRKVGLELVHGGRPPENLVVLEDGMKFKIRINEGLHEGLFLDQRLNRVRVAQAANNQEVLNGFCYTGSFSVACLKGGAKSTLNIDTAKTALDWTRENIELNGFDPAGQGFMREDVFDAMKRLGKKERRFGLVIQDPPPYSRGKGGVFKASKDYARLAARSLELVSVGGAAWFSCGAVDMGPDAFNAHIADAVAQASVVAELEALGRLPEDFPVLKGFREGDFQKAVLLRIKGRKPGGELTGLKVRVPIKSKRPDSKGSKKGANA